MESALVTNAMLVRLQVNNWSAKITDDKASQIIAKETGASIDAGNYRKNLLSSEYLQEINSLGATARRRHDRLTLAWESGSSRLLPIGVYEQYRREIDEYIDLRIDARERLIGRYEEAIEVARTELNDLFREEDYPEAATLRERITMQYHFWPVPTTASFMATIADEDRRQIVADIEGQIEERIGASIRKLLQQIGSAVGHCLDRLDMAEEDCKSGLRTGLIENLREIVELTPKLNFTNDPVLDALCEELRDLVGGVQIDSLRIHQSSFDKTVYDQFRGGLEGLEERYAGYFGPLLE